MYQIRFSKKAMKRLNHLSQDLIRRIQQKLTDLAKNPYASNSNVKKLVNREGYRLRVGDWRIIYEIDDAKIVILVLEIDTRGDIYK